MPSPVLERFLRYVTYDTQSREGSDTYPSTPGQLVAATRAGRRAARPRARRRRDRRARLRDGHHSGDHDEAGCSGDRVHRSRRHVAGDERRRREADRPSRTTTGATWSCPTIRSAVLRVADMPVLGECLGHDIVTASGTTLLGADNKAGVAEIMAAAEHLMAHPEIPHGPIRIAFTPDEEVGHGTKLFRRGAFRRAVCLHHGWRPARRARVRELLGRCHDDHVPAASTRIPGTRRGAW